MEDQAQTQLNEGALKGAKAHGKKHEVPFKAEFIQSQTWADFSGYPDVDLIMEGEGHASHLGKTMLYAEQYWNMSTPIAEGSAIVVFTAANGDRLESLVLNKNEVVEIDEFGNPILKVWGKGDFTGGSGRFKNATGAFEFTASHSVTTNGGEAVYKGNIKY